MENTCRSDLVGRNLVFGVAYLSGLLIRALGIITPYREGCVSRGET